MVTRSSEYGDIEQDDGRISVEIFLAVDYITILCYFLVWLESINHRESDTDETERN